MVLIGLVIQIANTGDDARDTVKVGDHIITMKCLEVKQTVVSKGSYVVCEQK